MKCDCAQGNNLDTIYAHMFCGQERIIAISCRHFLPLCTIDCFSFEIDMFSPSAVSRLICRESKQEFTVQFALCCRKNWKKIKCRLEASSPLAGTLLWFYDSVVYI